MNCHRRWYVRRIRLRPATPILFTVFTLGCIAAIVALAMTSVPAAFGATIGVLFVLIKILAIH